MRSWLLPDDFVVALSFAFTNHESRFHSEGPAVSNEGRVIAACGCWHATDVPNGFDERALLGCERARLAIVCVRAEEDRPDVGNHHGPHRIERSAASAANHEHRTVHELPAQFGES